MHGHACKHVKMHIKPMGGTNKHGKHIITRSGKGERYAQSNRHHGNASQVVTPKQGLMGIGCNHTTTNLLRVSSVVKPRTRKANISIKHGVGKFRPQLIELTSFKPKLLIRFIMNKTC